jgi:CBS domain containing-hemolysin-like protein
LSSPRTTFESLPAIVASSEPPLQLPSLGALADLGLPVLGLLILACALATVRRSIARAVAERLRSRVANQPAVVPRVEALLARIDRLAAGVGVLEFAVEAAFVLATHRAAQQGETSALEALVWTVLLGAPALWFSTDAVAQALAARHGDRLLVLAAAHLGLLLPPLAALGWVFDHLRRGLMRLLRIRDDLVETREIVADLRSVLADAEVSGNLQENEREIIGNVMDFRGQGVAELMTPRTAIAAADAELGVSGAARALAESGHSSIPIYEGTLDSVIGTISARDIVQLTAAGRLESARLQQIVHPAFFVPETKLVSELFEELRRQKIQMAIVLDEYGGTAGLITINDIVSELVGDIPDEYDEDQPARVRHLAGGAVEIDAGVHVSEVNEALELDLPEEADYQTLGGFVLAELGHFPSSGEAFERGPHRFEVVDANDRRVLKVRVRRTTAGSAT